MSSGKDVGVTSSHEIQVHQGTCCLSSHRIPYTQAALIATRQSETLPFHLYLPAGHLCPYGLLPYPFSSKLAPGPFFRAGKEDWDSSIHIQKGSNLRWQNPARVSASRKASNVWGENLGFKAYLSGPGKDGRWGGLKTSGKETSDNITKL